MLARTPKRRPRKLPAPARVVSLVAPYGGWNARDALQAMPPSDALQLDNFISDAGGLRKRNGYVVYATGLNGHVESLMEYSPPDGGIEHFAATADTIYDVTNEGAAVSAVTGLANARWQHVMFATTGGNFLVIANGADSVRNYNGTAWSTPSITGVTSSTLITVTSHFSRLWFVQKDTLDAWYLDTAAISGAATKLPLGPLCKLGGHLQAIASWSRDGGAGMEDFLVFLTSKGEALVYSGTDPSDATTWMKVGTYKIPDPIGRRCFINLGSDLGVLTSQGAVPFSQILPLPGTAQGRVAATEKISEAFTEAHRGTGSEFGWQIIEFSKERLAIVNVPIIPQATFNQFVMNTENGSWCRFKGINANCWGLKGDDLFFGGNTIVYKYGNVFTDDGAAIDATAVSAFTNLGTPHTKAIKMVRPMITGPDGYLPGIGLRTDYDTGTINFSAELSESGGAAWDEEDWDIPEWAPGVVNSARWRSLPGLGSVFAFALTIATEERFRFDAIDLMVEDGSFL